MDKQEIDSKTTWEVDCHSRSHRINSESSRGSSGLPQQEQEDVIKTLKLEEGDGSFTCIVVSLRPSITRQLRVSGSDDRVGQRYFPRPVDAPRCSLTTSLFACFGTRRWACARGTLVLWRALCSNF